MSSEETHVIAFLTPAPGKGDRLKEILGGVAEKAKLEEPGLLKYLAFEQADGVIVVQEIYKDEAAHEVHGATEYFKTAVAALKKEGVLGGPLDVRRIKPIFGYASK